AGRNEASLAYPDRSLLVGGVAGEQDDALRLDHELGADRQRSAGFDRGHEVLLLTEKTVGFEIRLVWRLIGGGQDHLGSLDGPLQAVGDARAGDLELARGSDDVRRGAAVRGIGVRG